MKNEYNTSTEKIKLTVINNDTTQFLINTSIALQEQQQAKLQAISLIAGLAQHKATLLQELELEVLHVKAYIENARNASLQQANEFKTTQKKALNQFADKLTNLYQKDFLQLDCIANDEKALIASNFNSILQFLELEHYKLITNYQDTCKKIHNNYIVQLVDINSQNKFKIIEINSKYDESVKIVKLELIETINAINSGPHRLPLFFNLPCSIINDAANRLPPQANKFLLTIFIDMLSSELKYNPMALSHRISHNTKIIIHQAINPNNFYIEILSLNPTQQVRGVTEDPLQTPRLLANLPNSSVMINGNIKNHTICTTPKYTTNKGIYFSFKQHSQLVSFNAQQPWISSTYIASATSHFNSHVKSNLNTPTARSHLNKGANHQPVTCVLKL